jgi:acetyl-CoA C-acetyltransferase
VVVARTADGARTLCHIKVKDSAMLAFFMGGQTEPVGKRGHIVLQDHMRLWVNA